MRNGDRSLFSGSDPTSYERFTASFGGLWSMVKMFFFFLPKDVHVATGRKGCALMLYAVTFIRDEKEPHGPKMGIASQDVSLCQLDSCQALCGAVTL